MSEIESCIDKLQRYLESKFKIPLTDLVAINQQELVEMLEDIYSSVPEELEESVRIKKQAEIISEKAQKEIEEIQKKVREIKEKKTEETKEIKEVKIEATEKIRKAKSSEYTEIKEIEDFSISILSNIEEKVQDHLKNIRKAREILREKKTANLQISR